jgi:CheY-like chemotaxis protein
MGELLGRTLGGNVTVKTVLASDLWGIFADVNQLENVVLNLAVNARDAMPDGGTLTIETSNASLDESGAGDLGVPVGDYVLIAVGDTGTGMPPEVVARAFEPFFTTKSLGKGTGLGLSQVFGFVRQSEGQVKILSEVGVGTTVGIYLPRRGGAGAQGAAKLASAVARGGSAHEVVLVVEDEARVRGYVAEALRELGYTVIEAASGAEALGIIEPGEKVTLLFTDVIMPEMAGRQLAAAAARTLPHLKVLFTTGASQSADAQAEALDPGANFLAKPFGINQLAAKVRSVLDS